MRPATITCQRCGEPAPNSVRGAFRKYHPKCKLDMLAEKRREDRLDPDRRALEARRQRDRRAKKKEDPEAYGAVLEQQRQSRARQRDRMNAYNELKGDLIEAQVAVQDAATTLNKAALDVNAKFSDHERRIRRLEERTGGANDPSERQPGRAPIFDRLRGG